MALPSQTARLNSSGRAYMYRRRRYNARPFLIGLILVLVIGGGVWALTRGTGAPEKAAGDAPVPEVPRPHVEPEVTPVNAVRPERAPERVPDPAPVEVRQGAAEASPPPAVREEPASPPPPAYNPALPSDLQNTMAAAEQKLGAGDAVAARVLLNKVLMDARTPESERATLRQTIAEINDDLLFSPRLVSSDPWVFGYEVQSGDGLERISKKNGLSSHWKLIQRINRMSNPNGVRLGQKLKLARGPFHAVVTKSAYRLDVFMGPPDKPAEWVFVRSLPVGLGEGNSTPTGEFVVRKNSKLENPHWVNPRTGEKFDKDNPLNPIGERWIGLEGLGEAAPYAGYGIHGTIDPGSIGQQKSMGCVRLGTADVELVYELLGEGVSQVTIRP